jgi:hypothetical protein
MISERDLKLSSHDPDLPHYCKTPRANTQSISAIFTMTVADHLELHSFSLISEIFSF